jgi:tripartite-type tricarboxylate transporter receptor subunit TctC
MALFANQAGIALTHVPYKGASQAAMGVAAGEVPVAFQGLATVTGLVRGGKARLIGVSTAAPLPQFPGVPTVSSSGLPGFEFNSWFTVMAPAGTPKEIVARLNAEIRKALADPEVRDKLVDQGLTVRGTSPEQLALATRQQLARYGRLIQEAGIKGE